MNKYRLTRLLLVIAVFVLAGTTAATTHGGQSQFTNAKVETSAVSESLETTVRKIAAGSQQPVWIAYKVDAVAGRHSASCCNDYHNDGAQIVCGICNLEEHSNVVVNQAKTEPIKLEQSGQVIILLRAEQKRVMRIRLAPSDCTLDAGGLRVVWLPEVKPAESVGLLTSYVKRNPPEREDENNLSSQALMAIAQHADASADRAYSTFVAPDQPEWLREQTSFWLGAARGKSGLTLLERMAKTDQSSDVRAKVSFALFVSREPEAVDEMIHMAKEDSDSHVRGQALFWLAQKAGQKASTVITGAIKDDPDTEVKKKAVFALTQMPQGEGIPKLIEVAQNNRNPEVRKQAMFWLGQSQDPRALAFFEKILSQ
jgi:hypothetical protein